MSIAAALLPEFDHEMANTRKALERVPMDKADWKPHEKSGTMQWLAGHLAAIPMWASATVNLPSIDLEDGDNQSPDAPRTSEELLAMFDGFVVEARSAIAGASDETLMEPWSLLAGGQEIVTMPKIAVLRSFIMNHMIHHRGQLTVYLRLNDVPVPALYGPSADEEGM